MYSNDQYSLLNTLYVIALFVIYKHIPLPSSWCPTYSWRSDLLYISIGLAVLCLLIHFLQKKTATKTKNAQHLHTTVYKICKIILPAGICLCLYYACLSLLSTHPNFIEIPIYFMCWNCSSTSTDSICPILTSQAQNISLFVSITFTLFILFYKQYKDTTDK